MRSTRGEFHLNIFQGENCFVFTFDFVGCEYRLKIGTYSYQAKAGAKVKKIKEPTKKINEKHQRIFSLSLPLSIGLNGPQHEIYGYHNDHIPLLAIASTYTGRGGQ